MIAIGYTRLSQQSDTSIERQRSHIKEYADERGWQLATVYDDGERASGFDSNREQYQRLRDRVRDDAEATLWDAIQRQRHTSGARRGLWSCPARVRTALRRPHADRDS